MSQFFPKTRSKAVPALSRSGPLLNALSPSRGSRPGRPCYGLSSEIHSIPHTGIFRHFSSFCAAAILGALSPASAAIVYSGQRDIAIPDTFDGVYLDIPDGTLSGSEFAGWDLNFVFGGTGIGNSPGLQPVRSGTGTLNSIVNLGTGALVDQFNPYAAAGSYGGSENHLSASGGAGGAGQFTVGQEGYLGFAATISGQTRYGWMRVILTNNAPGSRILDWAYDDTGATITTGTTIGLSHFTKNDPGLTVHSQPHTYGGLTTVSAGTLELTGNAQPGVTEGSPASGTVVNGSGTLRLSGVTIGNEALTLSDNARVEVADTSTWSGSLSLGSAADAIIDMGDNPGETTTILTFGTFNSDNTWTSTLSIWNWSGIPVTGGGPDQLVFQNSLLNPEVLARIQFYSDQGVTTVGKGAAFTTSGELVAIPESHALLSLTLLMWLAGRRGR